MLNLPHEIQHTSTQYISTESDKHDLNFSREAYLDITFQFSKVAKIELKSSSVSSDLTPRVPLYFKIIKPNPEY